MPPHHSIILPFSGFEDSWYDTMIDLALHTLAESLEAEMDEDGEEDRDRHSELFSACDFQALFQSLAHSFVAKTNRLVNRKTGIFLDIQFQQLKMPEEHNEANDRIFGTIDTTTVHWLFDRSAADDHSCLRGLVDRECSDDGTFVSFYGNDLNEWLKKPLSDWDAWETTLLAVAALHLEGLRWDEVEEAVQEEFEIGDTIYLAVESAISWPQFEAEGEADAPGSIGASETLH